MNRNLTPRPVRAAGAKDAHGSILDPSAGALYVHMHRESGLAHRHYVLKGWQVRTLRLLVSRPMQLVYVIAIVTMGWAWSQAARVPILLLRVGELTRDAKRLDTLTERLTQLTARYEQVQRMMAAARVPTASAKDSARVAPVASRPAPVRDTTRDTTRARAAAATKDTSRPVPPNP
ncbi:MAG: hypothetical protein K1X31_01125 [Gemmatimonadaceae bacterium]|nr:hypothetical protein [Gemmatimonadaceae bacterium]